MSVSLVFACGLTITLLAALAVVGYLRAPLRGQLQELCGNAERAEFWTAFSNVTVILTPAIFALLFDPSSESGTPALLIIATQLKWGLMGLVASVLMLGWILGRFIPRTPVSSTAVSNEQKAGSAR